MISPCVGIRRPRPAIQSPHPAGFVDPFLQDLASFRFTIEHQLVGIFRQRTSGRPGSQIPIWRNKNLPIPKVRWIHPGTIRHDAFAGALSFSRDVQDPTNAMGRGYLAARTRCPSTPARMPTDPDRQRFGFLTARRARLTTEVPGGVRACTRVPSSLLSNVRYGTSAILSSGIGSLNLIAEFHQADRCAILFFL